MNVRKPLSSAPVLRYALVLAGLLFAAGCTLMAEQPGAAPEAAPGGGRAVGTRLWPAGASLFASRDGLAVHTR